MGTCRYCGQNAGFRRKQHGQCRDLHATGIQEMTKLATQAACTHTFNEAALRQTLEAIVQRSRATDQDIEQALQDGVAQGVAQALVDGIMTRDEEDASGPSGTTWPWRTTPPTRTPSGTSNRHQDTAS